MNKEIKKNDLLKKLFECYMTLAKACIKNDALFKEDYLCGLQKDNKVPVDCKYKHFLQCNYAKRWKTK